MSGEVKGEEGGGQNSNHHVLSTGWIYALKPLYHFLSLLFNCIFPSLSAPPAVLCLSHLCRWMPKTKQQQDHTKRRQSVENQAPYREYINNKARGTHLRRAPSHLHMPLIYIFTKRPLWLSLISKKPSPQPHQRTPDYAKAGGLGNVCRLSPHTHIKATHRHTQMHKINFCTRRIQMCNGRVNREITKRVSEIWWCESWPCSSNFHPSFPSLPPLLLLSSRLSPLIIRYLVTSGPW